MDVRLTAIYSAGVPQVILPQYVWPTLPRTFLSH
jgi:hypothetical protein